MNHSQYSKYMRVVALDLFKKDTVERRPDYINSAAWERRKSLSASKDPKGSTQQSLVFLDEDVFNIPKSTQIGPYELSVLKGISNCQVGYLFFQGGSRSGKSSLMSFLEKFCEQIYSLPESDELTEELKQNKRLKYTKIVKIDFGQYDSDEDIGDKDKLQDAEFSNSKEDLTKFFMSLFKMTIHRCRNLFEEPGIFEDCFYDFYCNYIGKTRFNSDIFSSRLEDISAEILLPNLRQWKQLTPIQKSRTIKDAFKKVQFESSAHVLIGTIAPLWYLANTNNCNKRKLDSLVVVIDNVDPQPTIFQQKIAEIIRLVCSSRTWKNHFSINKINIVFPVRLSTFKRRIGQLGDFENLEHESFYPSDILAYRLKYFFFNRSSFPNFTKLTNIYQNAILLRFYTLWSHLSDRESYFRRMIDAISGTNINHGNSLAQSWSICSNFPFGKYKNQTLITEFDKEISSEVATAMLNSLWLSTIRALTACLDGSKKEMARSLKGIESFAEDCAKQFALSLGDLFRDYRITCKVDLGMDSSTRSILADSVKEMIQLHLVKCIGEQSKNEQFQLHKKELRFFLANKINTGDVNPFFLQKFLSFTTINIEDALKKQCCPTSSFDEESARLFSKWIVCLLKTITESIPNIKNCSKPWFNSNDDALPYNKQIGEFTPHISRFDAAWHLLQPKDIRHIKEISAENVFSPDKKILLPVALHILYALYHTEDFNMRSSSLIDLLENYVDDKNDIIPILNDLVRVDRRLIFCEVNDYEWGMERIIKEPNTVVYLSNAGRGYFRNLIITPPYLQWAFLKINTSEKPVNMYEKVKKVYKNLDRLVVEELAALKRLVAQSNRSKDEVAPTYLCATLDVYNRSLDNYVPGLLSYGTTLSKSGDKLKYNRTADLINSLVDNSNKYMSQVRSIVFPNDEIARENFIIKRWDHLYGETEKSVETWNGLRR